MRLPNTAHTSRPWRIHELTRDFRLEDVWDLRGSHSDEFPRLVHVLAAYDPAHSTSAPVRALFAARWALGQLLGWDAPNAGAAARVASLRERLPGDLRDGPAGPDFAALPFTSLYQTEDEWAAEIANQTMHGVLHVGLVRAEAGGSRVQMAVLVKPNGPLGTAYMAAIRPFRHFIVYPAITRELRRMAADVTSTSPRMPPRASSAGGRAG